MAMRFKNQAEAKAWLKQTKGRKEEDKHNDNDNRKQRFQAEFASVRNGASTNISDEK